MSDWPNSVIVLRDINLGKRLAVLCADGKFITDIEDYCCDRLLATIFFDAVRSGPDLDSYIDYAVRIYSSGQALSFAVIDTDDRGQNLFDIIGIVTPGKINITLQRLTLGRGRHEAHVYVYINGVEMQKWSSLPGGIFQSLAESPKVFFDVNAGDEVRIRVEIIAGFGWDKFHDEMKNTGGDRWAWMKLVQE